MRDVRDAVVAVVGASGGLGRLIATALEARGATVLRCGRTGPDVVLDIRDSRAGDALVRTALGVHGRLDGVVVASGVVAFGDLADLDPAVVEELFLVNALGPMWLAQRTVVPLTERHGFFAAITGVVAERPFPGFSAYAASKAALSSALGGLRLEMRRRGVAVIDARPPHTETGLATRPLAGSAPRLPQGLDPAAVAERIVAGIEADETELPSTAFA